MYCRGLMGQATMPCLIWGDCGGRTRALSGHLAGVVSGRQLAGRGNDMAHRFHLVLALFGVAAVVGGVAPQAAGKDFFLTIGGGYSRSGNQASLEKNVLFFERLLSEQK